MESTRKGGKEKDNVHPLSKIRSKQRKWTTIKAINTHNFYIIVCAVLRMVLENKFRLELFR